MSSINDRIRELRLSTGCSQREFSQRINIGSSTLAMLETAQRNVKNIHIAQICNAFDVNENWLRTGLGSMFLIQDADWIEKAANKYQLDNFDKALINTYIQLTMEQRQTIKQYLNDVLYAATQENTVQIEDESKITYIAVPGSTAAGEPIAYGDISYEQTPVQNIPRIADFALNVKGDSMEPYIKNGSLVFVHQQTTLENGEIGIFEIDGEVTCKKLCQKEDGTIELHSFNSAYDPIIKWDNLRVIGKVIR